VLDCRYQMATNPGIFLPFRIPVPSSTMSLPMGALYPIPCPITNQPFSLPSQPMIVLSICFGLIARSSIMISSGQARPQLLHSINLQFPSTFTAPLPCIPLLLPP
jgi:hypothetical protein